jgi:predicted dehydrogenase
VSETGDPIPVTAPDTCVLTGLVGGNVVVSASIVAVPHGVTGSTVTIHGASGTLVLKSAGPASIGPHLLFKVGPERTPNKIDLPARYDVTPAGTPAGPARNVARAYVRFAQSWHGAGDPVPDFEHAARRHRLLDAIERSSDQGSTIHL